MNNCQQCKFWNPPRKFYDGQEGQGNLCCDELGECLSPRFRVSYHGRRIEEPSVSNPDDASLGQMTLRCGPLFGCAHWSLK